MVSLTAPYVPGFLAFREGPFLVDAVRRLQEKEPHLSPQAGASKGHSWWGEASGPSWRSPLCPEGWGWDSRKLASAWRPHLPCSRMSLPVGSAMTATFLVTLPGPSR